MNRKSLLAAILLLLIAGALYTWLKKPHRQDPHYYAAVCVVINDAGKTSTMSEFAQKLQDVIINENSSYAFSKVEFDPTSAEGALRRYQNLSPEQKAQTAKSMNACLQTMLPDDKNR